MKLVREKNVPEQKYYYKKNQEIISLFDEFLNSDMDIASVYVGDGYDGHRNYNKLNNYIHRYYKDIIKLNKRDDKVYLSKINKED